MKKPQKQVQWTMTTYLFNTDTVKWYIAYQTAIKGSITITDLHNDLELGYGEAQQHLNSLIETKDILKSKNQDGIEIYFYNEQDNRKKIRTLFTKCFGTIPTYIEEQEYVTLFEKYGIEQLEESMRTAFKTTRKVVGVNYIKAILERNKQKDNTTWQALS